MNWNFDPNDFDIPAAKARFDCAVPFKHVIIDDFFEPAVALALHHAFPAISRVDEFKSRFFSGRVYGPPPLDQNLFRAAFTSLASRRFIERLSAISNIERLAMDETQIGAGAHIGLNGSELPIHADHNTHPNAPWLYRRLNVLVYLNPNFEPGWRSNLLLYDATGKKRVLEVEPRFNRAIIMDVNDRAFHGYHALRVPPGQSRQLLALYYYSPEPSSQQTKEPHGTIMGSPEDVALLRKALSRAQMSARHYIRKLVPNPKWTHRDEDVVRIHV